MSPESAILQNAVHSAPIQDAAAEPEVKPLFYLPDSMAVCALLPIGKPVRQLAKLRCKPVREFAPVDAFDGSPFSA